MENKPKLNQLKMQLRNRIS